MSFTFEITKYVSKPLIGAGLMILYCQVSKIWMEPRNEDIYRTLKEGLVFGGSVFIG